MSLATVKRELGYSPGPALRMHLIADLPSTADIKPYLERIDANRWYTNFGPLVCEFEQKMATLLAAADPHPQNGTIHLTTMTSCYQALEIGLRFLGVPEGGKVLVPAITFPGCAHAVRHAGCLAIFSDVDASSWALTPDIARRAAQKTKLAAVMPTALYGIPLSVAAWDEFSRETGIPVIIDAAAAIEKQGILRNGFVAHSLHATKPFGIGEGGVLVSRDPELIQRVRTYSNFGMAERVARMDGVNAKMSEYHAAVGLAQLSRWPLIKQKRLSLLEIYREHLKLLEGMALLHPAIDEAVVSLLMLRFSQPLPPDFIAQCNTEGIALHRTYLPPLYQHPYFGGISVVNENGDSLPGDAKAESKSAHMSHSEMINRQIVGVPFHPFMSKDDVAFVISTLQELTI